MDDETWSKVVKVVASGIRKMAVEQCCFLFDLFYSLLIYLYASVPPNSLKMICDFAKWWAFLTYDGLKSHVNVTEGLEKFQRRGSRLGRRRLGQALSIKPMINSRQISTRIKKGRSWIWHGGRFTDG